MPSTYTSKLRLTLMATGENQNTWGDIANTQDFQLIEDAIAGLVSVSANQGTITLTANSGSQDESRMSQIVVAGTLTSSLGIVAPSVSKWWLVRNNTVQATVSTSYTVSLRLAGGQGIDIPSDSNVYLVGSDGVRTRGLVTR